MDAGRSATRPVTSVVDVNCRVETPVFLARA